MGAANDMKLVSEVMDVSQIDVVGRYSDIYQVGPGTCGSSRCCGNWGGPGSPCC